MADVVSAPLAEFDGREWHEFHDFALLSALHESDNSCGISYFDGNQHINEFIVNNTSTMFDAHRLALLDGVNLTDIQRKSSVVGPFTDADDFLCSSNGLTLDQSQIRLRADDTITRCFGSMERTEYLAAVQIVGHDHRIHDNP
jgi:hypothetical protein